MDTEMGEARVADSVSKGPELVDEAEILETLSNETGKARDSDEFAVWRDCRVSAYSRRPWGNWSLLNSSWENMEVLTGKIWASPAKGLVHLFRSRVTSREGIVFLADCAQTPARDLSGDESFGLFEKKFMDGAVLWGAVKTVKGTRYFSLVVYNGAYQFVFKPPTRADQDTNTTTTTTSTWTERYWQSWDPLRSIREVIEKNSARLLTPAPEDGVRFEDLFATKLLREVRAGITALGYAWWGLYVDRKKLPKLKPKTGIVFCYMNNLDPGYLFEIVTEVYTHRVGFCSTPCGCLYLIMRGSGRGSVRIPFESVSELLAYVKGEARIQFLPRPAN